MEPLLEKELEAAAKRQGITKSQFIIAAVERALGKRDPATLYEQAMAMSPAVFIAEPSPGALASMLPGSESAPELGSYREALARKFKQQEADWLAYHQGKKSVEVGRASGEPNGEGRV
jgi:RHH-type rel operon transcriptional repressor/antitoxin RelB